LTMYFKKNQNIFKSMKNKISFFAVTLIAMLLAFQAEAQRFFDINRTGTDTLATSTTINIATNPVLIDVPYYYSIHVIADSLSGANQGVVKLQVSNDRTGTNWFDVPNASLTVDGPGQDVALWEGLLYARRIRVNCTSPTGTRKTKLQVYGSFKRALPN